MNGFRKVRLILLSLLFLLVAACNPTTEPNSSGQPTPTNTPGESGTSSDPSGTGGKKQLTLLMEAVPDTDFVQKVAKRFTEETGIALTFEVVNYADMHQKLLPQFLNAQSNYDVIVVDNYWVGEFTKAGWLEPLDSYIKKDSFDTSVYLPSMFNMVGQVEGTTYLLPFYNYTMSLVYREDIFSDPQLKEQYQAEFGRELKIPDNLEEYVNISKFITKATGGKTYGAVMQGLRPDPIAMEWLNYLYSSGGDFYDQSGAPAINNDAGVKALDLYLDNMRNAAPKGAPGFGFDEAFNVFAQGNAATYITYNWMLPKLNNPDESKVAGKVALAPVPGSVSLNGGWGWAIPKNAEDKEAAWRFISWIESFESAKERALLGGSPTRSDVFGDAEVLAKAPHYPQVMEIIRNAKMIPILSDAPQLIEILGRELSEAVSGNKTGKEALDTVASEIKDLQ